MIGTIESLVLAVAAFVGGHFILSSLPVRRGLLEIVSENGFRGIYSLFAISTFVWMLYAYGAAPYVELWPLTEGLRYVPIVVLPFACLFAVIGVTTRTATGVGGEKLLDDPHPVRGIATITRHPFLWGVALWGIAHIATNGDVASLLLFGGLVVLALGGMMHIDYRRRETVGSGWGPVALSTSAIPFVAVIQGRSKIDWAGIGLTRVLAGLAVYVVFLAAHGSLFGVPALP
ncbi:MAG: NnrU protein [Alphaproteobacteria bacterium]|nr:NnrU protein [Alphaproteobacteria bacterium]